MSLVKLVMETVHAQHAKKDFYLETQFASHVRLMSTFLRTSVYNANRIA